MNGSSFGSDSSSPLVRQKRITMEKQSSPTSAVNLYPVVFDVTDGDCCERQLMECFSWCAGDDSREPAPTDSELPALPDLSVMSAPQLTKAGSRSDAGQSLTTCSSIKSSDTTATGRKRLPGIGNKKKPINHRRVRSDSILVASSSSSTSATWVDDQENFENNYVLTRQVRLLGKGLVEFNIFIHHNYLHCWNLPGRLSRDTNLRFGNACDGPMARGTLSRLPSRLPNESRNCSTSRRRRPTPTW